MNQQRIACIFPGQGAQYVGMGQSFYETYLEAREVFQSADELLEYNLSHLMFHGPEDRLTETKYSQVAIFVASMATLAVVRKQLPNFRPSMCAGLSLGEYTAVAASHRMDFATCLALVQARGRFMNDACEAQPGTMAVVMGLAASVVEEIVASLHLPNDLWVANLNCPGQVVLSGTHRGVQMGAEAAKKAGAKRVLPLAVHGAFHSGLMKEAQDRLQEKVQQAQLVQSDIELVMNVPGDFVLELDDVRRNLIDQVTHPVRWESGVCAMDRRGVDVFVEMGCGKTLAGMNKRIGTSSPTISIDSAKDLDLFAEKVGA